MNSIVDPVVDESVMFESILLQDEEVLLTSNSVISLKLQSLQLLPQIETSTSLSNCTTKITITLTTQILKFVHIIN